MLLFSRPQWGARSKTGTFKIHILSSRQDVKFFFFWRSTLPTYNDRASSVWMKYIAHARLVAWWNCSHAYRPPPPPGCLGCRVVHASWFGRGKAALCGPPFGWGGCYSFAIVAWQPVSWSGLPARGVHGPPGLPMSPRDSHTPRLVSLLPAARSLHADSGIRQGRMEKVVLTAEYELPREHAFRELRFESCRSRDQSSDHVCSSFWGMWPLLTSNHL